MKKMSQRKNKWPWFVVGPGGLLTLVLVFIWVWWLGPAEAAQRFVSALEREDYAQAEALCDAQALAQLRQREGMVKILRDSHLITGDAPRGFSFLDFKGGLTHAQILVQFQGRKSLVTLQVSHLPFFRVHGFSQSP